MDSSGNTGSPSDLQKTNTQTAESISSHPGCGCSNSSATITVRVTPTTGGQFDLQVAKTESVENLKKLISKKLKVPKERICLLHRDRQLRDGTLQENQLMDGSRLTLLPSVETGLLAQRPEQSVMQALESLNDSQVNDFLSGKAPLNLTMRLGDHMMLIQLQLSTVTPSVARRSAASSSTSTNTATSSNSSKQPAAAAKQPVATPNSSTHHLHHSHRLRVPSTPVTPVYPPAARPCKFFLGKPPPAPPPATSTSTTTIAAAAATTTTTTATATTTTLRTASATSPLKSLENTVAAAAAAATSTATTTSSASASCKCDQQQPQQPTVKPTLDTRALAEASRNLTQTLKQLSSEVLTSRSDPVEQDTARARRQGAIIESMHHHGRGVYSGTFSGTLNPALQDRFGRPKRDISTIIHILNDLLCATPQYRRHARQGHAIMVEASAPKQTTSTTTTTATHVSNTSTAEKFSTSEDQTEGALNLSLENQATRGKMEHLRLIMEERRARRRARREARVAPYTTQWSAKSESLPQGGVVDEPMDTEQGGSSNAGEPQLCEMNPPEPVVA